MIIAFSFELYYLINHNFIIVLDVNNFLLILSSPSGAGKTSISNLLLRDPCISRSISYTTRPKRLTEIDGQDYHFVTDQEFKEIRDNGGFIETVSMYNYFYGTSRSSIHKNLQEGRITLFNIDYKGMKNLASLGYDVVTIFILPPSLKELKNRITNRNEDSAESIERRLSEAKEEIKNYHFYDYRIVNDNIEESVSLIQAIIKIEKLKRMNISDIIEDLCE